VFTDVVMRASGTGGEYSAKCMVDGFEGTSNAPDLILCTPSEHDSLPKRMWSWGWSESTALHYFYAAGDLRPYAVRVRISLACEIQKLV